ncbi:MAG: SDR family oxidoreductase [Candidatus Andeanibacterium colombiense]|uniref:SDR family oxidoreductase n=1 Tax=Candidatus Andeanibacterium colombiense TaxID=3121345 RepID=A0AAJ5X7W4_9SPHN|nr:MAG: SDR family oxidoreductase [Sphingomonadaceae bacterium]
MPGPRSIFISGGGSGIGRAIARHFAARGWFVGLGDINPAGMAGTANALPQGAFSKHPLDVCSAEQWRLALADFAKAAGGRIDVVVNNAGISHGGLLTELSEAQIDRVIDVNFRGSVHGARAAYPWLKAGAPGSCLLNVASASAIYGVAGMAIYSATKFALRSLTEALDVEWHADGIAVRSLMPSYIDTPMLLQPASPNSTRTKRETVVAAGLELTPVEAVAEAAWDAVHGRKVHTLVGRTARSIALLTRWAPGLVRNRSLKVARERLARGG